MKKLNKQLTVQEQQQRVIDLENARREFWDRRDRNVLLLEAVFGVTPEAPRRAITVLGENYTIDAAFMYEQGDDEMTHPEDGGVILINNQGQKMPFRLQLTTRAAVNISVMCARPGEKE